MTLAIVDATYRMTGDDADGISRSRYTMPIGNVPLITHVVGDLAAGGVSRARIVTARADRAGLERALDAGGGGSGLPVEVVEAPESAPRRGVLAELEAALGAEAVVLAPGDGLYPGLLGTMRERYRSGGVDLVLSAAEALDPGPDPRHCRLTGSALVLGPQTRALVAGLLEPDREDADLTAMLLGGNLRVAVCDGSDGWSYGSSSAALLAGNRRVLDQLPRHPLAGEITVNNETQGRISVGHGVSVTGCAIHGPVAIADHVVLEDCYVGPFTAIGPHAILRGVELDNSIVLTGAELRHPGHRITASIIGERTRVERSFELPRGVQLRLGPDARLTFT